MRLGRALALATALGCVAVVASPDAASAHGVGGIQPSNFETRIRSVEPRRADVDIRVVDLGSRLELQNTGPVDVVVLGYQDEPYLRVGPKGVFENVRSPAVYLNRTRLATGRVPASADATAPPEWRQVSSSTTARWHDHRAHWMGRNDPPVVQRDRGARHLVQRWTVFLERGSERIRVRGDLVWVPGPSPWPWLIGALVLALAVVVVVRSRHARITLVVVLALLVASESAHVIGAWGATTASGGAKLFASAYSLGGLALAVTAIVWVVRGGTYAATPLVLLAGLFLAVAGGLADITTLLRSQIPTTDAAEVARLEVMLALGLGGGLAVAAGLALRPGAARRPRVRVGAA